MDTKFIKILVGAAIGGGMGYFVGSVAVEYIKAKEELPYPWGEDHDNEQEIEKEPITLDKKQKPDRPRRVKNYTEHFKGNPELAALAAKYNGEDVVAIKIKEDGGVETVDLDQIDGVNLELISEDEFVGPTEHEQKDPSIISEREFANEEEFAKITLNYYDDDVLTDDHDTPLTRPEKFLGEDALVSFGELSEDEDVVYVRNNAKRTMYEIVRLHKNYAAPADPRSRRLALKKRVVKEEEDGEENTST